MRAGSTSTWRAIPGLTFDETAANMASLGDDPVNAVHLNIPSVNAPVMPGRLDHGADGDERQRPRQT